MALIDKPFMGSWNQQWLKISVVVTILAVFSVSTVSIGRQFRQYMPSMRHLLDSAQYYMVNIILDTSKPNMILLKYLGIGWYLRQRLKLIMVIYASLSPYFFSPNGNLIQPWVTPGTHNADHGMLYINLRN